MTIYFYGADEVPYGCFSNFSDHGMDLDGDWWPTSEHYFQAQKFIGTRHADRIRRARTPLRAAELGRDRSAPLRRDWERVKDDVMRRAVAAKFRTHADIRAILLSTGDDEIVEATTTDHYWGRGSTGTGKNMLGRILMRTRGRLRCPTRPSPEEPPPPRTVTGEECSTENDPPLANRSTVRYGNLPFTGTRLGRSAVTSSYTVRRTIGASPDRVWAVLTDAAGYSGWNTAVVSLRGRIALGEKLELVSVVDPKRTFKLKVAELSRPHRMVWASGMPFGLFKGVRTYELRPTGDDGTEFSMAEVFSGPFAPMITKAIPDLTASFEQWADGLKKASEG